MNRSAATQARINAIRVRLDELDAWLDKYRAERDRCPNFSRNQGLAHQLRADLCWLRDPDTAAVIYPRA